MFLYQRGHIQTIDIIPELALLGGRGCLASTLLFLEVLLGKISFEIGRLPRATLRIRRLALTLPTRRD
jgi:hypothetical protein